ncbi:hypothetical protein [Haloglomus salinum]|uniref:hypothetical protein n=1 Tax=Haloglomus salinum TaxID=2962673 RepID=UPI0020C98066|nr:hypothetical protein [Haloglomus salinum]
MLREAGTSLGSELRDGVVTGLLLVAPLAVTLFVVQFVVRRLSSVLDPVAVLHTPPTVGHRIFVPDDRLHETDLSVSRAVRLLVATGVAESEEAFAEMREDIEGEPHPTAD